MVVVCYQWRNADHSRRKVPTAVMTPERIKLVGDYLNGRNGKPHLKGPAIAKKMKISTASVYAFWKQVGPGKFVRKKPSDQAKSR